MDYAKLIAEEMVVVGSDGVLRIKFAGRDEAVEVGKIGKDLHSSALQNFRDVIASIIAKAITPKPSGDVN